jgi:hypothetical protein
VIKYGRAYQEGRFQRFQSMCTGSNVKGNKMAEISLGTKDRNKLEM